jgi:chloramphenicol-sensitive protein RarD
MSTHLKSFFTELSGLCQFFFLLAYFKSSWWKNFKDSVSSRKELLFLVLTATLITINWGTYILAVNLGRVVEGSMGYFLVPIINMLGGYIFFTKGYLD